jgi:hypothetical protein
MTTRSIALLLLLFIVFAPFDAFAYLDPGTGSAILQGIIGGIAALGVVLKLYWHRLLKLFGIRKESSKETQKETDNQPANKAE